MEAGGSKVLEAEQVKETCRAQRGVTALREVYPVSGFLYITCKLCSYGIERYQQRCVTSSKKTSASTVDPSSLEILESHLTRWKGSGQRQAKHGSRTHRTDARCTQSHSSRNLRGCVQGYRRNLHTSPRCGSSSAWCIRIGS